MPDIIFPVAKYSMSFPLICKKNPKCLQYSSSDVQESDEA